MQVVQAQAVFVKPLKNPPQNDAAQGAAQGVQEDERPQLRFQAPEEGVEKVDGDAIGVMVMDQVDHQDQGVGQEDGKPRPQTKADPGIGRGVALGDKGLENRGSVRLRNHGLAAPPGR